MSDYCVVVASSGQARLYTLEPTELPEMESGPNLVEREKLSNEEQAAPTDELWSEVKSSRNRAPNGGSHAYDDHRDRHLAEYERRFAADVAQATSALARKTGAKKVILVAHDRCLGLMRDAMRPAIHNGTRLLEVAKDLSKLSAIDIHAHLSREQVLPQRMMPSG